MILNGKEYLFEGIVRGDIATEEHGEGGFGYDPLFFPEGGEKTFAEMSAEAKNEISHRGRAVRKLAEFLQKIQAEVATKHKKSAGYHLIISAFGTRSRGRTGTAITGHRILSPACLPIPPFERPLTFR